MSEPYEESVVEGEASESESAAAAAAAAAAESSSDSAESPAAAEDPAAAAAAAAAAEELGALGGPLGGPPGAGPQAVTLGEAPELGEVAEVVVLGTSLSSIKRQFFSSKRVQHFLDCKGIVYFLIDCNRDTSAAMNLKDIELFKEWKAQGILRTVENPNSETGEPEVELPQVLVDGVVLGGEHELQELEEDGDLGKP
ncbi:Cgd7_4360 protein, related [Eimeria necatrix]|uniref:Cgd7_4360 protein, related n=1 Tax=Eimeria necatrix TaxID=51315 RepID=U6MVK0_9EIME|nr:Cgd7_4360 protein, related [Eimeria necatrix]CDJ68277.1 Cgd7_4360 protein, related [Eimeria necatrix]